MVSEIILGIILIVVLVFHIFYVRESNKQIRELSKLIKSKDAIEYVTATKIEENRPTVNEEPELRPVENMSDDQFFDNIKKQLNA